MNLLKTTLVVAVALFTAMVAAQTQKSVKVENWLTKPDKSVLFTKQSDITSVEASALTNRNGISIDDKQTFQTIDGFGYCLNGGSAQLLTAMGEDEQKELLADLFSTAGNAIGISFLRISIGASDLDDHVFSYNDLPKGKTDVKLEKFSLENDRRTGLIPILKKILKINPKIKIMGSPWSAPVWMKDNGDTRGGSLKPEYYPVYAQYFVKYIQGMKAEGIAIDAITIQNEPLHPGNNPSMYMEAKDQLVFVRDFLGPAFAKAGIKTKIVLYDHNCDKPDYPISILNDLKAKKFIDGSGFHLYGGTIDAMSKVHDAHPDKNLYFTEQWTGGPGDFLNDLKWNVEHLLVGATRNWAKTVLQWNLAADSKYDPHTDRGGCTTCMGAVTIQGSKVNKNVAYYHMAHASKFARPGSKRIKTNEIEGLPNVAFLTPDGKTVLVVVNTSAAAKTFSVNFNNQTFSSQLDAGAVSTYIF
ncbi:glycoside hydrolase family 30 beta sandwich domain-containing protein [Flavobacterium sp.]|uniref:glycoside hydrolase family 30 protein n=1 Tax=Flavobacterium sp. TaxID=239 RepID=UPI001209DE5D|nr:glycoside hydrolase family 30 beta sandwich domain-containing protein [Flavobacterium sp.]RZJ71699.1 MAG: glucosylceramidase [Flavobacterium sp.]